MAGVAALTLILAACGSSNKQTTVTVTQTNGGSAGSPTTSATGSTGSGGATNSSSGSSDASLQVAAAGYYEYTSFGDRQMDYYALIKNPNTATFDEAEVDFDFLSASGVVVDSEQEYANYIAAGQTMAIASSTDSVPAKKIANVQVRVSAPYDWVNNLPAGHLVATLGTFHAASNYGTYELKATIGVKSLYPQTVKDADVVLLYFGKGGSFVGYDDETAHFVPANGKALVSVDDFPQATVVRARPYASLTNISQIGDQTLE